MPISRQAPAAHLPLQKSWKRLSHNLTPIISLNDKEDISLIEEYPCTALLIRSRSQNGDEQLFRRLYEALPQREDETEPMMNIISWRSDEEFFSVVFPRAKHRPGLLLCRGQLTSSSSLQEPSIWQALSSRPVRRTSNISRPR